VRADDSGARLVSGEAINDEKREETLWKIETEEIRARTHAHTNRESTGKMLSYIFKVLRLNMLSKY